MEAFSALLAFCAGNSPVTGEFPAKRPVTRSFDIYFHLHLNQQLSKQWRRRWFGTPSRSLWRHYNDLFKPPSPRGLVPFINIYVKFAKRNMRNLAITMQYHRRGLVSYVKCPDRKFYWVVSRASNKKLFVTLGLNRFRLYKQKLRILFKTNDTFHPLWLNSLEEIQKYISIFYHFSTLYLRRLSKYILMEVNETFILYSVSWRCGRWGLETDK